VQTGKSLVLALAGAFTLLGCSSVKMQKAPFRDGDWDDEGNGYEPGDMTGGSTGTNSGSTSTGAGGTGAGGTGAGGSTGGGAGAGGGGAAGCQTFDYARYQAPATPVSLKTDLVPIFQKSCSLSSGCHSDKSRVLPRLGPATGVPDATALQTIRSELLAAATQVPALKFVSPGKPEESYLMNKIDGTFGCMGFACMTQAGCGERMPQLLDPLEVEKTNKIRDWIKQGAPAN
jgi:hypothetical protein